MNAPMRGSPDAVPVVTASPDVRREMAKLELEADIVYLEGCSTEFELARWLARREQR